jgi:S-adenosylmethionine hydrolase
VSRPILALLSDFGTRDVYVGAMKGAALAVCPEATIVDLGHDVPPHDVFAGALQLRAGYHVFPPGTVFVAVVDPGVGTDRRAIAVEAGGYTFLAPDNGLLTGVLRAVPADRVVAVSNPRFFRLPLSRTFEGRDRFAPAAAWVLRGTDLAELGPPVTSPHLLSWPEPVVERDVLHGRVLTSDRFGNLISSISRAHVTAFAEGHEVALSVGGNPVRLVGTYGEIGPDEVCALYGSGDLLELAARTAPAASKASWASPSAVLEVRRGLGRLC